MGNNQEWMRAATCGEDVDSQGHALPQLSSESRWGAPWSRVPGLSGSTLKTPSLFSASPHNPFYAFCLSL